MTATETNTLLEAGACYACYGLSESETLQLAVLRSWLLGLDATADTSAATLLGDSGALAGYGFSLFDILEISLLDLIHKAYL